MRVISDPLELRKITSYFKQKTGLVPTMGALHAGHMALVSAALKDNDLVIVSIYVNQTQFNQENDFSFYPRTLERDLARLKELDPSESKIIVFNPEYAQIYPDDFTYQISETKNSLDLCGADRPGHFTGVLTVVMKLLCLANADKAYFGEKDFQQLTLIKGLAKSFFLNTQIIGIPTQRDEEGLALSSRNERLTEEQLHIAQKINKLMLDFQDVDILSEKLKALGLKIDYVKHWNGRLCVAVRLGEVRLIDNRELR